MNLLLRLFWTVFLAPRTPRLGVFDTAATPFRTWLTDLDINGHMNNGVYLSLMDLGRVDFMRRVGLWRELLRHQWYPVVVAETIQFRRSLQPLQRFTLHTRILGWDEKYFWVAQEFRTRRGEVVATAAVKARFLARSGGQVSPEQIIALVFEVPPAPALPHWVAQWDATLPDWRAQAV